MIAKEKTRTVQSEGIQNSVSFGIKQSGVAHIFNVLRNQLYTDKETAFIREYATNAADAHVEAGCPERPIEITLPSKFNLEFKCRDFGPALSHEDVQNIFAFYGESTKRNTNEQTGMLGIGSKSAFAYGDNYVINSYIDGTKHTYNAFIDDTQVGQISLLCSVETDEENGLEIVIPVRAEDVDSIKSKATSVFTYFKTKPIVNGEQLADENSDVLYSGDGWKYVNNNLDSYHRSGNAVVVMGNIGYPIDTDQLKLKDEDSELANLACANLLLEMPLGEVEISASREGLQYTDFTIQNITNELKRTAKEIAKEVEKSFTNCETLWQAKMLGHELFSYHGKLYPVNHFVKKNLTYKGQKIDSFDKARVLPSDGKYDDLVELHEYDKGYRVNSKVQANARPHICAQENTKIILNDNCHRRGVVSKMVYQVETEGARPYLITFRKQTTENQKKQILKDAGLTDKDMVVLSTLQDAVLDGRYGASSGGSNYNPKSRAKVFVPNNHSTGRWNSDPQSSYWDTASVDLANEKVVYVLLDRFQYIDKDGCARSSCRFNHLVEKIEKANLLDGVKLIGVKISEQSKYQTNANATGLWGHIKAQLAKAIEEADISTEVATIKEYEEADNVWKKMAEARALFKGDTLLTKYLESLDEAKKLQEMMGGDTVLKGYKPAQNYKVLRDLANELGVELPKGTPKFANTVAEAIKPQYPMFSLAEEKLRGNYWGEDENMLDKQKIFADYVNHIESSPCDE